jgi:DNA-binding NarL/FixJ family response regulator
VTVTVECPGKFMVTSGAVPLSTCLVYDDRREVRILLARMLAEVPGVRRVIPVTSAEGLLSLAGEPGHLVVIGTRRPASTGLDAIRRILALRSSAVILVVGSGGDVRPVGAAVAAGATAFVRWDAPPALVRILVDSLDRAGPSLPELTVGPAPASPADGRGGERPRTVPSDLGISPRELEVLHGISRGLSNRELSRQLDLSENTVKSHVRRLFSRLGVHERAHAVARAYRLGLFACPAPEMSTRQGDTHRPAEFDGRSRHRGPDRAGRRLRPVLSTSLRVEGEARASGRPLPVAPIRRGGP